MSFGKWSGQSRSYLSLVSTSLSLHPSRVRPINVLKNHRNRINLVFLFHHYCHSQLSELFNLFSTNTNHILNSSSSLVRGDCRRCRWDLLDILPTICRCRRIDWLMERRLWGGSPSRNRKNSWIRRWREKLGRIVRIWWWRWEETIYRNVLLLQKRRILLLESGCRIPCTRPIQCCRLVLLWSAELRQQFSLLSCWLISS